MFGDNAKQTMEEFHLQTEKPQNLHNKQFVAVSPLSNESCNKENNIKSWLLLYQVQ